MHTRVLIIASSTRVVHKFMYRRSACAYNNIYIYNIRLVMITGILGISTQDARLRSSRCRNERLSALHFPAFISSSAPLYASRPRSRWAARRVGRAAASRARPSAEPRNSRWRPAPRRPMTAGGRSGGEGGRGGTGRRSFRSCRGCGWRGAPSASPTSAGCCATASGRTGSSTSSCAGGT